MTIDSRAVRGSRTLAAMLLADGTSAVGENLSWSWLWWVGAVLVGIVVAAYIAGRVVGAVRTKQRPRD